VCVIGTGAIGGWLGARLAATGAAEVSAIARGRTLAALDAHGWRLESGGELTTAPARVATSGNELGRQDVVVLAVKAPALPDVVGLLPPLLGEDTVVLPFMNGVPWGFGHGTALGDEPLESVDPGGVVSRAVPYDRVLGGVVHASCATPEPGLVRHVIGNSLIVGEPAGGASARVAAVGEMLRAAGFDVTESPDVRRDLWYKLWGNMTVNPVSALTGATADRILADPLVRAFNSRAMLEAQAIGALLGCPIDETPEDRHAVTARLGAFRTSMLQDVDAGRPIELDALLAAVHEIGLRLGVPTPTIDDLLGLARLAGRVRGVYPEA
jgi:2-dehydropantoate 2-reductase